MCLFMIGQERFGNMTRVYYREAMGALIVFDVTRPTTFEAVIKWKEDLDSKLMLANGQSIATVLLANKCDQGRELTNNGIKMDQFCKDHGFVGWFETSAKVRSECKLPVLANRSLTVGLADKHEIILNLSYAATLSSTSVINPTMRRSTCRPFQCIADTLHSGFLHSLPLVKKKHLEFHILVESGSVRYIYSRVGATN